jgi:glycine oxidase
LGAEVHEGVEVTGLELQGRKVIGVRTNTQVYHSSHTVLAAGPWSGIANRWLNETLPVRPVKGQRILLRKAGFLPKSAVRTFETYSVPWSDGTVLVAATREEGVFDEEPTAAGIGHLLSEAVASFPILKDAVFVGARAGVRPGTPDDLPIMGPVPGWEGLSIVTGHDHVGIMLSPGSGELMANYIDTGNARPLEPFSIARFSASA